MPSASFISRLTALLFFAACMVIAQTTQKTTSAKSKLASPAATKRVTGTNVKVSPSGSARPSFSKTNSTGHGRTTVANREKTSGGSARLRTRQVVVTRKLVHGHWVKTTQIVHADPGPSYQTHPDQERYQQIQQALSQKGYFKGEANGQWGDDSVAALKQFQTDRKLSNDGKVSALSLIGLGLGPTRETAAVKTDPALPVAQADPPNQ